MGMTVGERRAHRGQVARRYRRASSKQRTVMLGEFRQDHRLLAQVRESIF